MFYQSFKMAVKAIAGNKMRSFLTILGVVIGVVAIVVLVSIGQGPTAPWSKASKAWAPTSSPPTSTPAA